MDKLRRIKQVFLDMDGTIYNGSVLYPTTIPFLQFLREQGINYSYVTNNSSYSREMLIARLAKFGIAARPEEFYTAMEFCLDYLQNNYPAVHKVFWLGMTENQVSFAERHLELVEDHPDAVIIGVDRRLNYERLCRAAWFVRQNVPAFATHPDAFCPGNPGLWLLDCGALTTAIEQGTGKKIIRLGKPHPEMLKYAAQFYGVNIQNCLMVGDRLSTDIAAGLNAGCLTCQITGEGADHSPMPGIKPDFSFDNLGELQKNWPLI